MEEDEEQDQDQEKENAEFILMLLILLLLLFILLFFILLLLFFDGSLVVRQLCFRQLDNFVGQRHVPKAMDASGQGIQLGLLHVELFGDG